jgi:nucleoid-associated protein YgaU
LRGVVWFAWGVVALLIAATALFGLYDQPQRIARQPSATPASPAAIAANPPSPAPAAAPSPAASRVSPPSFDIVSVDRSGQAVIAGRAMPGDRVRVLDGDTPIGEVIADARGEWVLLPDAPIAPGNRQLAVEATGRDGGAVRRSPDVVALSVTPSVSAAGATSALAVLLPGDPGAAARILQHPLDAAGTPPLSLETAEYGGPDELLLSGSAEPGARLNVYAGERLLGTTAADSAGKWSLRSVYRQQAGPVELRLDQLAGDGSIARRVATPFNLPAGMAIRDGDKYVVERGNSLWLIARRIYGQGTRYTAIFDANHEQIRDPHWIYPGQAFRLPQP